MKDECIYCMLDGSKCYGKGAKGGTQGEYVGVGTAVLNGLLREGLAAEVRGDQRHESSNRKSHVGIRMSSVPGRENHVF